MTEYTSQSVLERYDLAQGAHDETWKIGFGPGITEDLQCLAAWAKRNFGSRASTSGSSCS